MDQEMDWTAPRICYCSVSVVTIIIFVATFFEASCSSILIIRISLLATSLLKCQCKIALTFGRLLILGLVFAKAKADVKRVGHVLLLRLFLLLFLQDLRQFWIGCDKASRPCTIIFHLGWDGISKALALVDKLCGATILNLFATDRWNLLVVHDCIVLLNVHLVELSNDHL